MLATPAACSISFRRRFPLATDWRSEKYVSTSVSSVCRTVSGSSWNDPSGASRSRPDVLPERPLRVNRIQISRRPPEHAVHQYPLCGVVGRDELTDGPERELGQFEPPSATARHARTEVRRRLERARASCRWLTRSGRMSRCCRRDRCLTGAGLRRADSRPRRPDTGTRR